jgi:hypothetical protein
MSDSKTLEYFAVGISVLALIASAFSAWYSRRQLTLTSGQIKAYVQVSDARLPQSLDEMRFVQIQLKIKNFGQTAAIDVQGDMSYQDNFPSLDHQSNSATLLRFGSMGPGFERTVTLTSNRTNMRQWPNPSLRGEHSVYFFGTVWYTDDTSREDRKEDWCYRLILRTADDIKKTELEPCTTLTFTSSEDLRKRRN